MKRVFLVVLDSLGIGALPDAEAFGDAGSHTLKSIADTGALSIPHLLSLGLGNIEGLDFLPKAEKPLAAFGRLAERSMGKDTTIGHWELAGVISPRPLPTYPDGFPKEIIEEFERRTGRKVLCNKPFSGTEVIKLYGEEHLRTGDLIVYTSADSVFQIAAHEEKVPLPLLYEFCRIARDLLQGDRAVGRVIARPFVSGKEGFVRTANRHDFSLEAPGQTLLDAVKASGKEVIGVGKISDIFASRGITSSFPTKGNEDGMRRLLSLMKENFSGLCFVNLVDFDSLYGHRNDARGYAHALGQFDSFLPTVIGQLQEEDVLILTADHGCDPGTSSTDHSREYVPLLIYAKGIRPVSLGTGETFSDVADTVAGFLSLSRRFAGRDRSAFLKGDFS